MYKTSLIFFALYLRYLLGATFIYAFAWKTWDMLDINSMNTTASQDNPIWPTFQCLMKIKYLWLAAAYGQLISGILLVTQRFSLLGAIIFFPIIFCIFLITWSIGFEGTQYIVLLMLLATTYLLFWDRKKLMPILDQKENTTSFTKTIEHDPHWIRLGILIALISIAHIWYKNPLIWLIGCLVSGVSGLILFLFNKTKTVR